LNNAQLIPLKCPCCSNNKEKTTIYISFLKQHLLLIDPYEAHKYAQFEVRSMDGLTRCIFPNCDGIFYLDLSEGAHCECPSCHKSFCGQCMVPMTNHANYTCTEYQALPMEQRDADLRVLSAALKSEGGKQCSKCKQGVIKNMGCNHMICICKHHFCYTCGGDVTDTQSHYSETHPLFDEQGVIY
jgi:hypothetical protein